MSFAVQFSIQLQTIYYSIFGNKMTKYWNKMTRLINGPTQKAFVGSHKRRTNVDEFIKDRSNPLNWIVNELMKVNLHNALVNRAFNTQIRAPTIRFYSMNFDFPTIRHAMTVLKHFPNGCAFIVPVPVLSTLLAWKS